MLRRVFTFAGILLLATAVVWMWSFVRPIHATFIRQGQRCRVWVVCGRAGIDNQPEVAAALVRRAQDLKALESLASGTDLLVAPPSRVPAAWSRSSAWALPALAAVLAVLTVLPPLLRQATWRIRAASGRCPTCGYWLLGNTSGTCPECGTAARVPPPAA